MSKGLSMSNWLPTSPLITGLQDLRARQAASSLDDWSIAELLRGERFAQSTPGSSPVPESTTDPQTRSATTASHSSWLADALWRGTPAAIPWPAPPPSPPATISEDPFERAAILRRRRTPRRPTMGPPFFDELPRDYASHLGPVPRGPDWEQVVTGPTPWSPLVAPPRARDWGRVLTGMECRRTEDGRHINCITPGGRRFDRVPAEKFPAYIGPGEPNYHSYDVVVPSRRRRNASPGITAGPAPGPFWNVAPATAEGTPNPAAPAYAQIPHYLFNRSIPGMRLLTGDPSWPVRSYVVFDQNGQPAVINVTDPTHPGFPGVVARLSEGLASGHHRVRNQGAGLSLLQSPNLPSLFRPLMNLRDRFTRYLWQAQSEDNINRAHRNSRYINKAHRFYRHGLPLE
jgi:hypothetical protein